MQEGPLAENFFQELNEELKIEIETKVGSVQKIEFFKENPRCVCKIRFGSSLHAEECIALMHDRFFDARQLKCYYWDGKTDFKVVKESEDALNDRINQFGDWLEGQELPEELRVRTEDPQQDKEAAAQSKIKSKREEKAATK